MNENKQLRKNFIWNIFGTGFNSFNSLFFLIIVTRLNGIESAGIFSLGFSTACIIYVIGIYAGRIYQVTELDKNIKDKDFLINRIITSVMMMICVLSFVLIRKYNFYKSIVFILLTLYKCLEAFSEVFYAILQKKEQLHIVGKSLFFKSLVGLILFGCIDLITKNIILSIIFLVLVNVIIIIFYDVKETNKYIDLKSNYNKENVIKIFKSGFSTFAIAFLGIYILNAPKYSIDLYLGEGYQTIFGIIIMPATVVGLVAQFLIHPFLNKIVELYENKELKKLKNLSLKLVFAIIVFGLSSAILAYLLGTQVLGFIYGIELYQYKIHLFFILLAATLYTIGIIYSSILTSIRETFFQFIIYIVVSIVALVTSNIFTKHWAINGAVIAYFITMFLHFMMYTIYTNYKIGKKKI